MAIESALVHACRVARVPPAPPDFESEVVPHLRGLRCYALRLTRDAHDAEDLVQETLLRAWRGFGGYAAGTNVRAWLNTILYRVHVDDFRRAARAPRTEPLSGDEAAAPPPAVGEQRERLSRALENLSATLRTAVVLRDVHELSYAEIAAALHVPLGTVMSRIHRGRTALRRCLGTAAAECRVAAPVRTAHA